MGYAVSFARHFARLVHLLLHESSSVDEQKGSLRALVTLAHEGPVRIAVRDETLVANDMPLPYLLTGVADLVSLLERHGVATLDVAAGATAADLLGGARLLAGIASDTAHVPLRASVRFVSREPPPPPTDAVEVHAPLAEPTPVPSEHSLPENVSPLDRLAATNDVAVLTDLLEQLAADAEAAARHGDSALTGDILHRVVQRERELADFAAKRAFFIALRRIFRPPLLRAVAAELDQDPARRGAALVVLARAGESGAEVVIERLLAASDEMRPAYLTALRELPAGVAVLVHMLGDARWSTARSAALLLGELEAHEAEGPLMELGHHDDERVRHAATIALMRLGTPRSTPAIERALKDSAPQMRMLAAAELVARRPDGGAAVLLRALDDEDDDEVRAAFLLALGRLATPEAIERLIAAARPERGLFKRKMLGLRIAAVQALGEARTPAALEALGALRDDRDDDVRASVRYVLNERSDRSPP
ncbi:MAG TPA: HEAT repeat domain-containing protein [Gemmatimonadaceae bacterium]